MVLLKLNGLRTQQVTLSDGSIGEFVWNDGVNTNCYFYSLQHIYTGFEVSRTAIKSGALIQAADGSVTYKIEIIA